MEALKGYRTLIVNGLVFAFGLLQAFGVVDLVPSPDEVGGNVDTVSGAVAAIVAVVNGLLRYITTTPVGEAE